MRAQHDENVYGKVGTSAAEFEKALTGKKVVDVGQQGKYFWYVVLLWFYNAWCDYTLVWDLLLPYGSSSFPIRLTFRSLLAQCELLAV